MNVQLLEVVRNLFSSISSICGRYSRKGNATYLQAKFFDHLTQIFDSVLSRRSTDLMNNGNPQVLSMSQDEEQTTNETRVSVSLDHVGKDAR
jgi:hypothetical protein